MFLRLRCFAFNFWNLNVRPALGSIIPVDRHTFGNPEKRQRIWLGAVLKEWTVSPEEAEKTRRDDVEMMRVVFGRRHQDKRS